ncbi:MAG TPA: amidase family protein, partial [Steroidobacteraceae bacterium]
MLEILAFSATHQARLVRQRAISSVELVQAHLARIATVNPRIHAVIEVFAAPALAAADATDRAVAQGTPAGPLCGIPFSIKDSIELAGAVCT